GPKPIKASMPGRVVRVLAQQGEDVGAHQGIVVIEAMKMQNEMKSPKAGRVAELRVTVGDTVSAGDVLAVIE
ncbi:MAG TPA: acetyl-CoA carboxylase biotin carboxyl carrier protein subunit, partial [Alloacidobacterium sp.]|nr:acetyl-CoA carboxylase biotin carboxyl carrier protein subunit [Alloacidobacterium sp.]